MRCVRGVSQSRTESSLLFYPSAALRTAITRLISGPEDQRTKERGQRDLPRLPSLDQTLDAALARVSHIREFLSPTLTFPPGSGGPWPGVCGAFFTRARHMKSRNLADKLARSELCQFRTSRSLPKGGSTDVILCASCQGELSKSRRNDGKHAIGRHAVREISKFQRLVGALDF